MYEEPKFEEVLAYRLSSSGFRRRFGAIIQSSTESMIFLLSLFIVILFDLYFFFTGDLVSLHMTMWLKILPLTLIIAAGIRLFIRQTTLNRCIQKLRNLLDNDEEKSQAVAYRLTDREIINFSSWPEEKIFNHIKDLESLTIRGRVLSQYFLLC